ncbi:hypothetical protein G9A89_022143 [Geosiphon pyriformis]|nr:hypothetical protein G9A89_022143 [Geosiphon pyriformis]
MEPKHEDSKEISLEILPNTNEAITNTSSIFPVPIQQRRSKRHLNSQVIIPPQSHDTTASQILAPSSSIESNKSLNLLEKEKLSTTRMNKRLKTHDPECDNLLEKESCNIQVSTALITKERDETFFKNFRLRRIVKENHGHDINELAFFFNPRHFDAPVGPEYLKKFNKQGHIVRQVEDTSNILATVGDIQANIYDNEHCGDHLDIMSNFSLEEEAGKNLKDLELLTCCWLHRPDDALLAVAGKSKIIYILSLTTSRTLKELSGHADAITDLKKYPQDEQHLLSASRDGTVALWKVDSGECLYIFETDASVICWQPSGVVFLTGGYNGEIRLWVTPDLSPRLEHKRNFKEKELVINMKKFHNEAIDCIRFVNEGVLSKSVDGKLEYWNPETMHLHKSYTIKNGSNNRSKFDVSLDDRFFCVGTNNGSICIYNIMTGKLVTELRHRRSMKAIRCCAFTRDCRQIIVAGEESYIWRYDYVNDETLKEWEKWTSSD